MPGALLRGMVAIPLTVETRLWLDANMRVSTFLRVVFMHSSLSSSTQICWTYCVHVEKYIMTIHAVFAFWLELGHTPSQAVNEELDSF
jgi:hypothetical protein